MNTEPLHISILFKGLSRPVTLLGVDYDYLLICVGLVMMAYIWSNSLKGQIFALLMLFPLHLLGWILCKIDPHIFKLLSARAAIGLGKNNNLWGCQCYEPF